MKWIRDTRLRIQTNDVPVIELKNPTRITDTPTGTSGLGSLFKTSSNTLLAGDGGNSPANGRIFRSTDAGLSWTNVYTVTNYTWYVRGAFCQLASGRILAVTKGTVYYSDNDGVTWAFLSNVPTGGASGVIFNTSTGRLLGGATTASTTNFSYSDDGGVNWTPCSTYPNNLRVSMTEVDGILYMGFIQPSNPNIYRSLDNGVNWSVWKSIATFPSQSGGLMGFRKRTGDGEWAMVIYGIAAGSPCAPMGLYFSSDDMTSINNRPIACGNGTSSIMDMVYDDVSKLAIASSSWGRVAAKIGDRPLFPRNVLARRDGSGGIERVNNIIIQAPAGRNYMNCYVYHPGL